MPTTLSVDLRQRAVTAVAAGAACRQAAERFGVSHASVSRWSQQQQREGHVAPKPLGGDRRSGRLKAHPELILPIYQARPQLFLSELRAALHEHRVEVSTSSLSRFFARHRITRKRRQPTRLSRSDWT